MTASRQRAYRFGLHAETLCVWWLRLHGYAIVARRLDEGAGEIDIIARRGRVLAVIEVKARRGGSAGDVLTARQRARITRAAETFAARRPAYAGHDIRFDLMVVRPWRAPRHIVDAWRP